MSDEGMTLYSKRRYSPQSYEVIDIQLSPVVSTEYIASAMFTSNFLVEEALMNCEPNHRGVPAVQHSSSTVHTSNMPKA